MQDRFWVVMVGLFISLGFPGSTFAQNSAQVSSADGWPEPVWAQPPITDQNRKPAPRRNLEGTWGPAQGPAQESRHRRAIETRTTAGRRISFRTLQTAWNCTSLIRRSKARTPFCPAERQRSKKSLRAVGRAPRTITTTSGSPKSFEDEYKVVILYQYDNRWRVIWTDGRELPKQVEGGVEIGGEAREQRFFGYSRWQMGGRLHVRSADGWNNAGRPRVAGFDRPAHQ